MKKEDIIFGDWHRWLFGQAPPAFAGEVALRAAVLVVVMLLIVRWLGRRMMGRLSISELAVLLTLGSIVGGALQNPAMGVLPSVVVLLALLGVHRLSNWLAFKFRPVELVQQGEVSLLVRDGCLDLAEMQRHALSHEQLFGLLRNENILHLGQVRRAYFEANGRLSIYQLPAPQPGLSVLPPADAPPAAALGPALGHRVCATCGRLATPADWAGPTCPRCHHGRWATAALPGA